MTPTPAAMPVTTAKSSGRMFPPERGMSRGVIACALASTVFNGARGIDATVTPELEALPATCLEVATRITAVGVDSTGVGLALGAVVNTRAARRHHESHLSEMTGVELLQDVLPREALPSDEICCRHQDGARALVTTRAARQAVEVRER